MEQIEDSFIENALGDMETRLKEFCSLTITPKHSIFQIAVTTLSCIGSALGAYVARTNELVNAKLGNFLTVGITNRESETGDKEGNLSPYAEFEPDSLSIIEGNQAPRRGKLRKTKDPIIIDAINMAIRELNKSNGIQITDKVKFVPYEVLLTFIESLLLKMEAAIKEKGLEKIEAGVDNLFVITAKKNDEGHIEIDMTFGPRFKTEVKADQVTEKE